MASIVSSVDIDQPVEVVYDHWTRFEDFPRFMDSVAAVRQLDEQRLLWVALIRGERREWVSRITEQVPDQRIAWTAEGPPADNGPANSGVVTFHRLGPGRTRVHLQLEWQPGGLFDRVGERTGMVRRRIDDDLQAFADHVRATGPVEGWRGTIDRPHDHVAAGGADRRIASDGAGAGTRPGEDHPGEEAGSPTEIPKKGWVEVLKRTKVAVKRDNVQLLAAGVAFYAFLALVPALIAMVSLMGLVGDPDTTRERAQEITAGMPESAANLVTEQIEAVTTANPAGLGLGLLIALAGALWSASKAMQALVTALNAAYGEEETRKGLKLKGLALALTVGGVVALSISITVIAVLPRLLEPLGPLAKPLGLVATWPLLGALVVAGLAVVYRFAPDRDKPKWRWVSHGAVIATVLWLLGSIGFQIYAENFGNYNETFGALSAVVVLMMWFFLSAFIIILGAEIDVESERQTHRDSTVGPEQPMGLRGADAADRPAPVPAGKR
jgi:membrane protein